jgi:ribosomal protein L7Ae-like RNA K-turn-binding protein
MNKLLSFISLTKRAGAAQCGANQALSCARANKAKLFILAADAAQNTKNDARNMAQYKNIRVIEDYTKDILGQVTGCEEISLLAISDEHMAANILSLYNAEKKEGDVNDKIQNT